MDNKGVNKYDLNKYCRVIAKDYSFASELNSTARQSSAERAWSAISRFFLIIVRSKLKEKKGFQDLKNILVQLNINSLAGKWARLLLPFHNCFGDLLRWIVDLLPQNNQELPIAMDATNIGQNFTVLSINVLYRRCSIPVAWKVVKGTERGSWKPHWQELFRSLQNIVPQDYLVIVSADRGLYADWLYQEIVALGWHPFLRINHQGQYLVHDSSSWQPLTTVVTRETQNWSGQVTCFQNNPINCTLLAQWDDNYADPWLILTDLNPTDAHVSWYGFRSWIECSYRDVKSDGWQWQRTRLRQADRAERHWLAMAVAMLWMVTLGGEQELASNERLVSDRSSASFAIPTPTLSCFLNGLLTVVAQLLTGQSLFFGRLFPLPLSHFNDLALVNSS